MKFNLKKITPIPLKLKIYQKSSKTKNQQPTNDLLLIELRNPDFPSLMEIRRSEVKPCRALPK